MKRVAVLACACIGLVGCVVPPPPGGGYGGAYNTGYGGPVYPSQRAYDLNMPSGYSQNPYQRSYGGYGYGGANLYRYGGGRGW